MEVFATDIMRYTFEYDAENDILQVTASGKMDAEASPELFKMYSDQIKKNKCYNGLADYRDFTITDSILELYDRPRILSEFVGATRPKIAVLVNTIDQDYYFLETIYVNRGFDVKLFTDWDDATQWLIGTT